MKMRWCGPWAKENARKLTFKNAFCSLPSHYNKAVPLTHPFCFYFTDYLEILLPNQWSVLVYKDGQMGNLFSRGWRQNSLHVPLSPPMTVSMHQWQYLWRVNTDGCISLVGIPAFNKHISNIIRPSPCPLKACNDSIYQQTKESLAHLCGSESNAFPFPGDKGRLDKCSFGICLISIVLVFNPRLMQ